MSNLMKNCKLTKVSALAGANTSEVDSDAIDMLGYDGCVIFTTLHVANAGNYLKVAQDDAAGLGTKADLLASKVVCATADEILYADVYKPTKRYLCGICIRAGASTAMSEMFALQYKGKKVPVTNIVTLLCTGVHLYGPAEGTA